MNDSNSSGDEGTPISKTWQQLINIKNSELLSLLAITAWLWK